MRCWPTIRYASFMVVVDTHRHTPQPQAKVGNKWSVIAQYIPGKTGQQCAQRWRHRVSVMLLLLSARVVHTIIVVRRSTPI